MSISSSEKLTYYNNSKELPLLEIFNEIISSSYLEVKNLSEIFLQNSIIWDDEKTITYLLTIIVYFFDNNYHLDLEHFLSELKVTNISNKLRSAIDKISNEKTKLYFKSRLLPFDIYVNFFDWIEDLSCLGDLWEKVETLFTYYLDYLKEYEKINLEEDVDTYFSSINSVISYMNYFVPFLLLNNFEKLTDYVLVSEKLVSDFEKIVDFDFLTDLRKIVFVGNVKFLEKLSNELWMSHNLNYKKYMKYLTDLNAWYGIFTLDYAKLDILNWKAHDVDVNFPGWIDLLDQNSILEKVSFLEDYAWHLTVKKFASLFKEYLKQQEKTNSRRKIYWVVNFYIDSMVWYYRNYVENISFSEFINVFKSVLIRLWNLPLTLEDIKIKYYLNKSLHSFIQDPIIEDGFKYVIYSDEIKTSTLKVSFMVWSIIDVDTKILESNKYKIESILKNFFEKLDKINKFLQDIEIKLSRLSTHPETLEHMKFVWKLFELILSEDELEAEKNKLIFFSKDLFINFEDFFLLIWYLHDIWKSDNLHNLIAYDNFNWKLFPTWQFLYFISLVLGDKIYWKVNKLLEDTNIFNDRDIYKIIEKYKNDKYIVSQAEEFLYSFNPWNYITSVLSNISIYNFIEKIDNIFHYLKEKNVTIKILKNNDFRRLVVNNLKAYLENKEVTLIVDEKNIDLYLFSILIFLFSYSDIARKELTVPHITYWMQFFLSNSVFNYFSWVLLHHATYPHLEDLKKYHICDWLKNFYKVLWMEKELKNLEKYKYINEWYFSSDDKDIYMVILVVADIIDALLASRNYQWNIDIWMYDNILNIFNNSFKEMVKNIVDSEKFKDKEKTFNKIIEILDKEFYNNPNWPKVRNVILKKKDDILLLYNNKYKI